MLKKICKLFLGLVVCAGSACVTPTHASSALPINSTTSNTSVIITKIQAASPISARDELIEIYNTTGEDIDISNWCFTNKASVAFVCFEPRQANGQTHHPILPAGSYATVVSDDYMTHLLPPFSDVDFLTFVPSNQSSGSMVASSDILTLMNADDEMMDSWAWQTAATSGKLLARQVLQAEPILYSITGSVSDWQLVAQGNVLKDELQWTPVNDVGAADDNEGDNDSSEVSGEQGGIILPLEITELLPNPIGLDTGNEFIEVYNPNPVPVSGADYKLLVGAHLDKSYAFPADFFAPPLTYTAIKNDLVKYSLNNTAGAVQLMIKGVHSGTPITYENPPEGESWANIYGKWQYTNQPTAGMANSPSIVVDDGEVAGAETSIVKPCAENQYRSVETGRCRRITTVAPPAPCKENQTRNPETGRCRSNTAVTSPTPCKAGQERNPETNRCRTIVKMSKVGSGVKPLIEKTQQSNGATWYVWVGAAGIVSAVLSYAIWEWREELQKLIQAMKKKVKLLIASRK